jgi:hypothetical protein
LYHLDLVAFEAYLLTLEVDQDPEDPDYQGDHQLEDLLKTRLNLDQSQKPG